MKKSVIMKMISIAIVFAVLFSFASCSDSKNSGGHQYAKITMENGKSFVIELYPEYAPKTVENFVTLVKSGFYDGLTFHRIVEGFMAQGGDPDGNGTGGSENTIVGEFSLNGYEKNTLYSARRDDYEQAWVLISGHATVRVGAEERYMSPGDLTVIRAGEYHDFAVAHEFCNGVIVKMK